MDLNTSEQKVIVGSVLTRGLLDLQKFMFSKRYDLTASALTRVCPSMTGLMLGITFKSLQDVFLLLLLNAFLKVRAVNFKADLLFQVPSNVQRVQQLHHPLVPPPPLIS